MISKIKLRSDQLTMNSEIQRYTFFHSESKSSAGGVGVYVEITLNPSIDRNLNHLHDRKQLFIGLSMQLKSRNLVYRVIYRHPVQLSD